MKRIKRKPGRPRGWRPSATVIEMCMQWRGCKHSEIEQGLTQQQIADKYEVHQATVNYHLAKWRRLRTQMLDDGFTAEEFDTWASRTLAYEREKEIERGAGDGKHVCLTKKCKHAA